MAQFDQAERAYTDDPGECPFCGYRDISWEGIYPCDRINAVCSVDCPRCGAQWCENYVMTSVHIELEGSVSQQIIKALRDAKKAHARGGA